MGFDLFKGGLVRLFGLNIWAILTATALGIVLAAWYGPSMFGNAWLAALGKDMAWAEAHPRGIPTIISLVSQITMCTTLAWLLKRLDMRGFFSGMCFGALITVAFIIGSMATDFAWSGMSWTLFALNSGYRFIYLTLAGGILGAWR
jgi:hypothetical protein